ncbi:MAG: amidohydrolase family protein, partial [Clostridiales bacterium]
MLFKNITLIDEHFQIRTNMYLGINGKKIVYIGETPPEQPAMFGTIYSKSSGKLFIPGFFNAHSHGAMHLLRGYGENLSLHDWLNQRIFPFEAHLTPADIYWSTVMGALEMLRFGIVSTTDMYMKGEAIAAAFRDSGLKANFSAACTCMDDRSFSQLPAAAETMLLRQKYHGFDQGRLQVDFALHGEYTSTEKIARGLAEAAAKEQARIHVHVAETAAEATGCRERHQGRSVVQYLADCGIFDSPATAAHSVYIDDQDIAILAAKGVSVASCPKSNLKLASGICPAAKLLQAGVNLALGTDSVASNNNLNMLEEIKTYALLHKGISGDPTLITPGEALYAATKAGAIAQGRLDCGTLK